MYACMYAIVCLWASLGIHVCMFLCMCHCIYTCHIIHMLWCVCEAMIVWVYKLQHVSHHKCIWMTSQYSTLSYVMTYSDMALFICSYIYHHVSLVCSLCMNVSLYVCVHTRVTMCICMCTEAMCLLCECHHMCICMLFCDTHYMYLYHCTCVYYWIYLCPEGGYIPVSHCVTCCHVYIPFPFFFSFGCTIQLVGSWFPNQGSKPAAPPPPHTGSAES